MKSLFAIVFILPFYRGANPVVPAVNPCGAGMFNCLNGQCISQSEVCDFVTSCADGSDEMNCGLCDFEHSQCGWTDVSSGQFRWQRRNTSMKPLENGPPHDVTYGTSGTGNYMMVVPRKGNATLYSVVKLLSPVFGNLAATCTLQFAHFEVTGSRGLTAVYLMPPGASSTDKMVLLWQGHTGYTHEAWTVVRVAIDRRRPGYRLLFAADVFTDSGDAVGTAIDAVHFTNCSLGIPTGRCLATQFTCKRGSCIDRALLCDFNDDCGDNSDEEDSICTRYTSRCDFEQNLCNLIKDDDDADNFNWEIGSGVYVGGPWFDHTYGTPSGSLIYITAYAPFVAMARARLKSPVFQASTTGNCRLRFFYYILTLDSYQLNLYTASSEIGPLTLVWKQTGRQVESWIRVDISLTSAVPFLVIIEGENPSKSEGDNLAVDDVSFTPQCEVIMDGTLPPVLTTPSAVCGAGKLPCDNGKCISSSLFCNFRADCSDNSDESRCPARVDFEAGSLQPWTNDFDSNSFNWTLGLHGNSTPYTGPRIDHTTGTSSGRYAIVKANISAVVHECQSYLISPLYNQAGKTCRITLWYSVQGPVFNTTNVYMRSGGTDHWLMSLSGSWPSVPTDPWRFEEVVLPVCASAFQIVFEAKCAGLYSFAYKTGYVAIDDLNFVNCSYPPPPSTLCLSGEYRCGSGHCISSQLLCDFQADCCDGSDEAEATCQGYSRCDFENGMCGWSQTRMSQLDWHRGRGGEPQYWPRAQDHTSGSSSGHYIYILSKAKQGGRAALVYNLPKPKGACVLRFWYHQHGSNSSELNMYMNTSDRGMLLMKSFSVEQRKPWDRFSAALNSSMPFQVVIEGVVGDVIPPGFIIAIDDVSFTPGCGVPGATNPTVSPKPPENCTTDQFFANRSSSATSSTTTGSHVKATKTSSAGTVSTSATSRHGSSCLVGQFKCSSSKCISSLLVCDGVRDCDDKSDETHCPRCQANQYYCSQTGRCSITNATRCDGVDDCGDSSDESLCTGACPAQYCQQGASCVPGTKTPQCGCTDSYHGNRCQYKTARQQGSEKHSSSGWKVGLGVAVGVLGLVLVAVTVFLVIRNRKLMISRSSDVGMNNPVFDDFGT